VYSNTSDAPIGLLLEHYRALGCVGLGEVMPNLPWLDPRLQNLLYHAEKIGFPLIFDMTSRPNDYGILDDPGMPQLETCLARFPGLLFIGHGPAFWAEIAALRDPADRFGYPDYPVEQEGRVARLMRDYPNLALDLSAGSGENALLRDPGYAVSFLNEFSDRMMFGTDICTRQNRYKTAQFLLDLRAAGEISPEAFEGIARENAQRYLLSSHSSRPPSAAVPVAIEPMAADHPMGADVTQNCAASVPLDEAVSLSLDLRAALPLPVASANQAVPYFCRSVYPKRCFASECPTHPWRSFACPRADLGRSRGHIHRYS